MANAGWMQVAAPEHCGRLLQFFLANYRPGLFLHFERVPDRLPEALRQWIVRFPPGALQFEVGIQTFNPKVSERISRRQDVGRLESNLRFLREQTGVHIHADLIAGLPGESLASFAAGFDRLLALRPHEIQVGILKRLRGTPIVRHDAEFGMVYSADPPYEILETRALDFGTLQQIRRFARYWDLVSNSGRFAQTAPLIWKGRGSAFASFLTWSDWLYARAGQRHGIALNRLAEFLYEFQSPPAPRLSPAASGPRSSPTSKKWDAAIHHRFCVIGNAVWRYRRRKAGRVRTRRLDPGIRGCVGDGTRGASSVTFRRALTRATWEGEARADEDEGQGRNILTACEP